MKVGGYIFEEFYFNLENALLSKADKEVKTYHVGDTVPVEGDSFEYPGYFDIVSLENNAAVLIRDKKVLDIIPLDKYAFMGLPVVDERGFASKSAAMLITSSFWMSLNQLIISQSSIISGSSLRPTERLSAQIISG